MSSSFLLVQTIPGKECDVADRLTRLPEVTGKQIMFPGTLAVKIECARDAIDPTAVRLARLDGVVRSTLYRARNA